VRVLIAPDNFTGTLTAVQAAVSVADGWHRHAPDDDLDLLPLSDGGPGFVDVLNDSLGGRLVHQTIPGPLGDPVPAVILLTGAGARPGDGDGPAGHGEPGANGARGTLTAYIESAQACGLHLVPADRRDPRRTSTFGIGSLLAAARDLGAERIVVGLGGSGTNDAGAGALLALAEAAGLVRGERMRDLLGSGGGALAAVKAADLVPLAQVRESWSGVDLVIASDVDAPLLGGHGASLGFGRQKGATPEQMKELEAALMEFARAAVAATGVPQRMVATPGAGAAGGLGFGLMLLGGRRTSGIEAIADAVGLADRIAASDLVITGEGKLDWQSLRGKVVAGVSALSMRAGVPVVALAGQVEVGRRELLSMGIESAYPVARNPEEVKRALADPAGTLADRAERVARTWSRQ
jgi:glycerate kinase